MPDAWDDFLLVVVGSTAAELRVPSNYQTWYASNGGNFEIEFQYKGGINPGATRFEATWHTSDANRGERPPGTAAGSNLTPSGVTFDPTVPLEGYNWTSGSLSARAPTLARGTSVTSIFARIIVKQGALNAPAPGQ